MKFGRTFKNIVMILMIVALGAGAYFTMDYAGSQLNTPTADFAQWGDFGGKGGFGPMGDGQFPGDSSTDQAGQTGGKVHKKSSDTEGATDSATGDTTLEEFDSFGAEQTDTQTAAGPQGTRPEMPQDDGNNRQGPPEMQQGEMPSMPDGENTQQGEMPSMPDGENAQQGEAPAMPNGENTEQSETPEMPDGENAQQGELPEMPTDGTEMTKNADGETSLDTFFYVLLAVEWIGIVALVLYLILSKFNKKGLHATIKSVRTLLIYVLCTLIVGTALGVVHGEVTARVYADKAESIAAVNDSQSSGADATGALTLDAADDTLTDTYTATESDESAVLVTGGSSVTLSGATVTKTGDSTNTENSEFYGVNAAILVQEGSSATIENAEITTDAKGANAVFATGTDAKITITDSTITTTGASSSRGLDATYGGTIEADRVTVTTQGGSCAALATDRGEGTVIARNSTLETNGSGSPVIYSTGDIQIENTTGTANGSQMVVIEGKNSATVTNSTLTASGKGNRNDADHAGIMIYQSMSGDAGEGTGTFTATDSSLSVQASSDYYTVAPMFFVTNTDAVINLTNTQLSFGSGVLLSATTTSEWGNSGANGGNVTLNATNQTLTGEVVADEISTVAINLTGSTFEGAINSDNTAKAATLTLDAASTVKLTGDTYLTALEDADSTYSNIDCNGYTLYVNGVAVK